MSQQEMSKRFHGLHVPGEPLVLYNIWDAGSARIVERAGALAIGTGSWSVAAAMGYDDGQKVPLEAVFSNARRIVESVSLPVSIDFEGAYAVEPEGVKRNVRQLFETGAVGMNFEDQNLEAGGQFSIADQAERIAAARSAAEELGVNLFINARADTFLLNKPEDHASVVDEAIERGLAYQAAGASGVFVPGLSALTLIEKVCNALALPVNVLASCSSPTRVQLAGAGVARISHGPWPFRQMADYLLRQAQLTLTAKD